MINSSNQKPSVMISGATGFIGCHVVKALTDQGWRPACIVRFESNPRDVHFLESLGARIIPLDLAKQDGALASAMKSSDVLVHLIGSIAPPRGVRLDDLQTGMAEYFFRSSKEAGLRKVILVTAIGSGPLAPSEYQRTKGLAEEALKRSGLDYVILRPSLVIGRAVGSRDSKIVRRYLDLIRNTKKVPLVFGGKNRIQPVFVGDLARVIVKVIGENRWNNSILELGGSEVLTTRQFVEALMKALKIKKDIVAIPAPLAWLGAVLCEMFQAIPLLSRDQLKIAERDSVPSRNALVEDFGIEPTGIDTALKSYIQ